MKNIITINLKTSKPCDCECVVSVNDETNAINLELDIGENVCDRISIITDHGDETTYTDFVVEDNILYFTIPIEIYSEHGFFYVSLIGEHYISRELSFYCQLQTSPVNCVVRRDFYTDDGYVISEMPVEKDDDELAQQVEQNTQDIAKNTQDIATNTTEIKDINATLDNLPEIAVETITTNVVKSDTMQATWCYSKYMLVQYMETNFDALDVNQPYTALRKYIRVYDDNIEVIEAEISHTETEDYTDPNGQKLYWTAVTGENAYKFFTYTSPLTIAKDQRPEGLTDEEFEELYTVKVRKTVKEYIKCSLGFPLNTSDTGEPELIFGTGDDAGNGKYRFVKDSESGRFVYTSRTDSLEYGVVEKDDGTYLRHAGVDYFARPMKVYETQAEAEADTTLPIGGIAIIKG